MNDFEQCLKQLNSTLPKFILGQFPVVRKLTINGGAIRPTGLLFLLGLLLWIISNCFKIDFFYTHYFSFTNFYKLFSSARKRFSGMVPLGIYVLINVL